MSDEKRILWTPRRKQEIVLRLLRGESPREIARELGLGMSTLYTWRDRFLEAGLEGLKYGGKSKALHDAEEELRQASPSGHRETHNGTGTARKESSYGGSPEEVVRTFSGSSYPVKMICEERGAKIN